MTLCILLVRWRRGQKVIDDRRFRSVAEEMLAIANETPIELAYRHAPLLLKATEPIGKYYEI